MEAKVMKKISQAYTASQTGVIIKSITDSACIGDTEVKVDSIDSGVEKYLTGLGYKIEEKEGAVVISW